MTFHWNEYRAYAVVTFGHDARRPKMAVTMIRDFISQVPIAHYYAWTLLRGLPPRWAQAHLELFASKVMPAFR